MKRAVIYTVGKAPPLPALSVVRWSKWWYLLWTIARPLHFPTFCCQMKWTDIYCWARPLHFSTFCCQMKRVVIFTVGKAPPLPHFLLSDEVSSDIYCWQGPHVLLSDEVSNDIYCWQAPPPRSVVRWNKRWYLLLGKAPPLPSLSVVMFQISSNFHSANSFEWSMSFGRMIADWPRGRVDQCPRSPGRGGGVFHNIFGTWVQHTQKIGLNRI